MKIEYKTLFSTKKISNNSTEILRNLLEVWDSDHVVIICSPTDVFNYVIDNEKEKTITINNWLDTKDNIFVDDNNSYTNYLPEAKDAWKYTYKRLDDEISSKNGNKKVSYLAIVEKDNNNDYLVRGLIKATNTKIQYAFNPLYELYMQKSMAEKHCHLFSDESPSFKDFITENQPKTLKKQVL